MTNSLPTTRADFIQQMVSIKGSPLNAWGIYFLRMYIPVTHNQSQVSESDRFGEIEIPSHQ